MFLKLPVVKVLFINLKVIHQSKLERTIALSHSSLGSSFADDAGPVVHGSYSVEASCLGCVAETKML